MLTVQAVPAFKDNYIWLLSATDTPYVAIVDPGDAKPVYAALERLKLTPIAILITHHHWDHTAGVSELCRRYALRVYGPAHEAITSLTDPLIEGNEVALPQLGLTLRVLDVPGHTRGAIAYYGAGALFCGDTLFTAGCGFLFEGTPAQMHASLTKLAALPGDTLVYCGHEYTLDNLGFARIVEPANPDIQARLGQTQALRQASEQTVPATLAVELHTNPFLRCAVPEVIAAAEHFSRRRLLSSTEVFAALRHWKDTAYD